MLLIRLFFALVLAVLVSAASALAVFAVRWSRDVPDYRQLDSLTLGSVTRVYARDRTLIATLSPKLPGGGRVNRTLVTLEEISPYMTAALVTSEDRRFFEHYGVDPIGLARAMSKIASGARVEGGSTLTNQIVKDTLLRDLVGNRDIKDVQRKVKEWIVSLQVERSFTKEEIIQTYLNVIYWGDGGATEIRGIYAAAQAYFGKLPKDLTLMESLYLTTLIPNGNRYFSFKAYRPLMLNLLERMVEDGWVSIQEARDARLQKMVPNGWQVRYDSKGTVLEAKLVDRNAKNLRAVTTERAPFFVQQVEKELLETFGAEKVYGAGGLTVYTTLDLQAQDAMDQASLNARMPIPAATMAAVTLDPMSGQVLAMVGQKLREGETPLEWNNAAQGQRQVGSSIKPILYTAALEQGIGPDHTELDVPTTFSWPGAAGGVYTPQNFGQIYSYRQMPLRESLDKSLNIPTIKLAYKIGIKTFAEKLKQLDLPVPEVFPSLAIGTVETTPLKMAAAYAPFVNGGFYHKPSFLTYVQTASGQVLYDFARDQPRPRRVWSPQVAFAGWDYLKGVVNDLEESQGGLAFRARIPGWQVGGKTGTTNDVKDIWFLGATPRAVGAVWMGIQQGGSMPQNVYSGEYPPPVWRQMVSGYLRGKTPSTLEPPEGVAFRPVQVQPRGAVQSAFVLRSDDNAEKPLPPAIDDLPRYQEVEALPTPDNSEVVAIDRRNGLLADEFTPADQIVMRRVVPTTLPGFQPIGQP